MGGALTARRGAESEGSSMASTLEELREVVGRLSAERQRQVLAFARQLAQAPDPLPFPPPVAPPPGTPPEVLLRFSLPKADVEAMQRAIEEDCETIEPDEHEFPA